MPYSVRTKDGIVIRNIPDDVKPDDPSIRQRVEAARADPNLKYKQMQKVEAVDPTEGMSGYDKFMAGAGKSVADLGLGARQLVGTASQEEVDEVKQRDAPLMNTGAGIAGNIAGNVGMAVIPGLGMAGAGKTAAMPALQAAGKYALSSPATLGGIATQGGLGALQSGLQPVATGESRVGNTALGFAGGAAIPAAGLALKGGKAALEPAYQSGREAIMGRTLRRVSGGQADEAVKALRGAQELVPGSLPTAGQASGNAGVAALERAAFAVEPTVTIPVAQRLSDQNLARVEALRKLAGEGGRKALMTSIRDEGADEMYGAARRLGVDKEMAKALKPQIDNLMARLPKAGMHSNIVDRAKELARLNGEALDDMGSVQGLHWIKLAVDDLLSTGKQTGLGKETTRALTQFKSDLLSVVDELSPAYGQARQSFAEMSKLPNQMAVAGEIGKRAIRHLDEQLMPGAFARALSDDTAKTATGFKGSTLANTMEPDKMASLNAIKQYLARAEFAKNAGRGVGSDTVQKMAYTNLMEQSGLSGLPNLLSRPVQLAEYGSRMAYGSADKEMRRQLAEALLDPKRTAELMQAGIPSETARKLGTALRAGLTPVGRGGTPALLDAR